MKALLRSFRCLPSGVKLMGLVTQKEVIDGRHKKFDRNQLS